MKIRRVVTGHDKQGNAVFVSDQRLPPITVALLPGYEFHRLWGSDRAPQFPDAGMMPPSGNYFPPIGGFRFAVFTIPPADAGSSPDAGLDLSAAREELEAKLPGLVQYLEPDEPGMHTTPTIDFEVVIAGEVTLELDNGATVALEPGDTVVQNGTRHRWRNHGTVSATVAMFICGAHHAKFSGLSSSPP